MRKVAAPTTIPTSLILSILLAVWGASSLWGIGELFEQRERVAKGWFPKREKKNRRGGR